MSSSYSVFYDDSDDCWEDCLTTSSPTLDFSKKRVKSVEEFADMHHFDSQLRAAFVAEKTTRRTTPTTPNAPKTARNGSSSESSGPPASLFLSTPAYIERIEVLEEVKSVVEVAPILAFGEFNSPAAFLRALSKSPSSTPPKPLLQTILNLFAGWKKVHKRSNSEPAITTTAPPPPPTPAPSSLPTTPKASVKRTIRQAPPSTSSKSSEKGLKDRRNHSDRSILDRDGDVWGKWYAKYPTIETLPWVGEYEESTKRATTGGDRASRWTSGDCTEQQYSWAQGGCW